MALFNVRLGLKHKIAAIGAVVVLGAALIGGIYLAGSASRARFQRTADTASAIATATDRILIGVIVTTVVALAFFIGRMVSLLITAMIGAMRELADGHLAVAIPSAGRDDEIN